MVGVVEETISHDTTVIHAAETWLEPHSDVRVRSAGRMVDVISCVPWRLADGDVRMPVAAQLREPGHVPARSLEPPAEGDRISADLGRPVIRYHHALLVGDERHVMRVRMVEGQRRRPKHPVDARLGPTLAQWHPFA